MRVRGLYAITDRTLLAGGKLLPFVEAALLGGTKLVQYRDKSTDHKRRLHEASALQELCARHQAALIINDDLELAATLGAGLHLGQGDGSLRQARTRLGPTALIGATCHAQLVLAQQAAREGASYLAFGRFFASHTKPDAPPAPLELLSQAQELQLPCVAIGGITPDNAPQLIRAGASALAVVHSLFAAPTAEQVQHRAQAFTALFASTRMNS